MPVPEARRTHLEVSPRDVMRGCAVAGRASACRTTTSRKRHNCCYAQMIDEKPVVAQGGRPGGQGAVSQSRSIGAGGTAFSVINKYNSSIHRGMFSKIPEMREGFDIAIETDELVRRFIMGPFYERAGRPLLRFLSERTSASVAGSRFFHPTAAGPGAGGWLRLPQLRRREGESPEQKKSQASREISRKYDNLLSPNHDCSTLGLCTDRATFQERRAQVEGEGEREHEARPWTTPPSQTDGPGRGPGRGPWRGRGWRDFLFEEQSILWWSWQPFAICLSSNHDKNTLGLRVRW